MSNYTEEKYILCNDPVCEGDKVADALQWHVNKVKGLEAKLTVMCFLMLVLCYLGLYILFFE